MSSVENLLALLGLIIWVIRAAVVAAWMPAAIFSDFILIAIESLTPARGVASQLPALIFGHLLTLTAAAFYWDGTAAAASAAIQHLYVYMTTYNPPFLSLKLVLQDSFTSAILTALKCLTVFLIALGVALSHILRFSVLVISIQPFVVLMCIVLFFTVF